MIELYGSHFFSIDPDRENSRIKELVLMIEPFGGPMLSQNLKDCLENNHVPYTNTQHRLAYSARPTEKCTHIPGKEFTKTILLKVDGKMTMAVIPALRKLDINKLQKNLGADSVEMISENETRDRFPEYGKGTLPPIGSMYGMNVIAASALRTESDMISFNGGSQEDLVKLKYRDFEQLVQPKVIECSDPVHDEMELGIALLEAIDTQNWEKISDMVTDDFTFSGPMPDPLNKEEWLGVCRTMTKAFSDWSHQISDVQATEDGVRIAVRPMGTHDGDLDLSFMGMSVLEATHQCFELPLEHVEFTFKDGKIREMMVVGGGEDGGMKGILKQLGVKI